LIWTCTCVYKVTSKVSFVSARSILTSLRRHMNVASHEARLRTGLRSAPETEGGPKNRDLPYASRVM